MEYKLFDIQKGSFVDGPGIRTVIFFRGCNLRCAWCHNPESQSGEKSVFYYAEKCVKCGACNRACPNGAIQFGVIQKDKCTFCGNCELHCSAFALKVCGFEKNEQELLDIIRQDEAFFKASGGGVTFSGGECMLFPDKLVPLLKACRSAGIHTAIDTAGDVPWESFEQVLPYTDLFLYDVKTLDNEKHLTYVGAENRRILQNLKKLSDRGAHIWVRVPQIPSVNDSEEEKQEIEQYLKGLHVEKVEFLPYHALGENKYAALGKPVPHF